MPLATHKRRVTSRLKCLTKGDAVFIQRTLIPFAPIPVDHVAYARLMLVETGQQART